MELIRNNFRLDDPEIKYRCKTGWRSLNLEIAEVPEFETCFANCVAFYRNLPWDNHIRSQKIISKDHPAISEHTSHEIRTFANISVRSIHLSGLI